jgi:hypothetical protein
VATARTDRRGRRPAESPADHRGERSQRGKGCQQLYQLKHVPVFYAHSVGVVILAGRDVRRRFEGRKGNTPVGRLVVRIDAQWVAVDVAPVARVVAAEAR